MYESYETDFGMDVNYWHVGMNVNSWSILIPFHDIQMLLLGCSQIRQMPQAGIALVLFQR